MLCTKLSKFRNTRIEQQQRSAHHFIYFLSIVFHHCPFYSIIIIRLEEEMAVEPGLSADEDSPKTRFVRYLYIGKEYSVYHAGTWSHRNHFTLDKISSVEELAADKQTELYPIQQLKIALNSKLIEKPETLIFALAACTRQQKSEKLRQSAYQYLSELCKDTRDFFLFVSFASELSKQKSIPRNGFGHGWRNAINKWYTSKNALGLAECVTKYKSRHGWSHKDIIKLSHPVIRTLEPDIQIVFNYIMHGLEKIKESSLSAETARVADIINYIEQVENFRQCQDPIRIAGLIRTTTPIQFGIDYVNSRLIKSSDVWEALVETMPLSLLIENLQKIHNLGVLLPESQVSEKVISAIMSKDRVIKSKLQPASFFMAVKNYEDPDRVPVCLKRRMARKHKLRHRSLPEADYRIIDAIYSALNTSFSNVEPTGLRYLITTSTASTASDGWKKNKNTVQEEGAMDINQKPWVLEAACIIALSLIRADDKVTISAFSATDGLNARPINIEKNANFHEAIDRMKSRSTTPPNLGKPILWAAHHRRKYDVFINVIDKMREKFDLTSRAMDLYKKKMNLPNTRLVNWIVGSTSSYMEGGKNVNDVLTICGFDKHVPKIIEAFAKRQF